MTVEFEPKNKDSSSMGVSNGTWFWLLDNSDIGKIVNPRKTNDPIDVTEDDALRCAEVMKSVDLPDGWSGSFGSEKMRICFVDFFTTCGGFTTY